MIKEKTKDFHHSFLRWISCLVLLIMMITLVAIANASATYVVTYDCNGHGTMYTKEQVKEQGVALTLFPYSHPEADHYVFWGWSTNSNATEPEYLPGDQYTKDESVTLYAVWSDEEDLGEITAPAVFTFQETPQVSFSKVWYRFTVNETGKYYIKANVGSQGMNYIYTETGSSKSFSQVDSINTIIIELPAGSQYYMCLGPGGKALEITISKADLVVTYDCNGHGSMYSKEQVKEQGVPLTLFPYSHPEADHYVFWGWSTNPNATIPEYLPGDQYTKDESATLYAVWSDEEDLGEITTPAVFTFQETPQVSFSKVWYRFTVSETGKYYIKANVGSQGMNYIYTETGTSKSFSQVGSINTIIIELTAGSQYYMCLGPGGKALEITVSAADIMVSYDCNGHGSMYSKEQIKEPGIDLTLFPYSHPEADHYVFWGWSTNPNATEPEYLPGDQYTKDESVTLYAVWSDEEDLGEILAPAEFTIQETPQVSFSKVWYRFTVSETWKYYIKANVGSQGMNYIYTETGSSKSFSQVESINTITIELTMGSQYYMCLGPGGKSLEITFEALYEDEPYNATMIIPAETTVIEAEAFANDTFESVKLTNVQEIKSRAFAGCTNLKKIIICASHIIIAPDAFDGISEDAVIVAFENSDAYGFAKEHGFGFRRLME